MIFLEYIAGKMMLVRSIVMWWDLNLFTISSDPIKIISSVYDFIALTPMQLEKSLDKIKYVKTVIVGGSKFCGTPVGQNYILWNVNENL